MKISWRITYFYRQNRIIERGWFQSGESKCFVKLRISQTVHEKRSTRAPEFSVITHWFFVGCKGWSKKNVVELKMNYIDMKNVVALLFVIYTERILEQREMMTKDGEQEQRWPETGQLKNEVKWGDWLWLIVYNSVYNTRNHNYCEAMLHLEVTNRSAFQFYTWKNIN